MVALLLRDVLQQKTVRELLGMRSITHRLRRVHGTPEGYTACCCGEQGKGGGKQAWTWDLPLLGSKTGVSRILWVHSLLANLKHNSRN